MPRGANVKQIATRESRAKGAAAANAARTRKREEREAKAEAKLSGALDKAITRYVEALDAELPVTVITRKDGSSVETGGGPDYANRLKAADKIVDRLLGKPSQRHEHGGQVDINVEVAEIRERLTSRLADRASRRKAK
jgi:hypothetical protein